MRRPRDTVTTLVRPLTPTTVPDAPAEPARPIPDRTREPDWGDFLWTHLKADGSNTTACWLTFERWIAFPWPLTCPRCRELRDQMELLLR